MKAGTLIDGTELKTQTKIHMPMNTLFLIKKPEIHNGGNSIFNKWCWSNWMAACRRKLLDPSLSFFQLNSLWIKCINTQSDIPNLIEEKVGNCLELIGTGENFLNRIPLG